MLLAVPRSAFLRFLVSSRITFRCQTDVSFAMSTFQLGVNSFFSLSLMSNEGEHQRRIDQSLSHKGDERTLATGWTDGRGITST